MSKWIVALLVGLLSLKSVLCAEASFMDDFNDDMGFETGSFESEQISFESEDISRRDLDDEASVIGSFVIPEESSAPITQSVLLPAAELNKFISDSSPTVQLDSLVPSEPPKPVARSISSPALEQPPQSVPSIQLVQPVQPAQADVVQLAQPVPTDINADSQQNDTIAPTAQPQPSVQHINFANEQLSSSSNIIFSMEVSNVLDDAPSLQEAIEEVIDDEEEEIPEEDDYEGGVMDDQVYEEITYSRPRATYSEDSQSDSSDAEWYALIHSRRPKSNNQPPPVTNVPSSKDRRYRDDRYDDRHDRRGYDRRDGRRDDRYRDDYRSRDHRDDRGENRERLARYDPAEAQSGPYFVPVNNLKQREHRLKTRNHRDSYSEYISSGSSSSSSQDSYTSSGYDDKGRHYTRHHHGHRSRHSHGKKHKRKPGYFENLCLQIPKNVSDI